MSFPDLFKPIAARRHRRAARRISESGSIAALLAVAIIPLIGFVGIATDTARAYLVKSRLSSSLDAAGLAGGRAFFSATRDDDIRMYFNVNFPAGYLGSMASGPTIVANTEEERLFLSARATVPTSFMRLFGFETVSVYAEAEITRQLQALDLVIAIDLSGSMSSSAGNGMTRIAAARNAANVLVNILFGEEATKDLLKIGLVPWNGKVNVMRNGVAYNAAATVTTPVASFVNPITGIAQNVVYHANNSPVPLLAAPPVTWRGCVYSRYVHDGNATNDADVLLGPIAAGNKEWPAWQPIGPEGEPVSGSAICTGAVGGNECIRCLNHGITALQNSKAAIQNAINALTTPDGSTNITQGLGWAWEVLMPGSPFDEAVANPPYRRQQAIVLLTDGENFAGSGDGYRAVFGYGNAGRPAMDQRLLALAANVKASGVIVYVIQFANQGTGLQTLLQTVASGPGAPYYFYAPDGDALANVFREVANHLSELRLSR